MSTNQPQNVLPLEYVDVGQFYQSDEMFCCVYMWSSNKLILEISCIDDFCPMSAISQKWCKRVTQLFKPFLCM